MQYLLFPFFPLI